MFRFNLDQYSNVDYIATPSSSSVHSPIFIVGNTELDAFCAGNGTSGNATHPHIIENLEITISNNSMGIRIDDTTRYLIIRNCTVTTEFSPADQFDNPESYGIFLDHSQNVQIVNCTLIDNDYGVALQWAPNNVIEDNIFYNNSLDIHLHISDSVNITRNKMNGLSPWHFIQRGITSFASDHTNIVENTISNTEDAIIISDSNFNLVSDNNITNSENGIIIENNSHNNTISNNNAHYSSEKGLSLVSSTNNTIYDNNLIGGGFHIFTGSYYGNNITANLVNQKQFYYGLDQTGITIDGDIQDYGQVLLVNCSFSTVKNLDIIDLYQGIRVELCENITIIDNILANNLNGIVLGYSNYSVISKNDIIGNKWGIYLTYSNFTEIFGNNCSYNTQKNIYLTFCYNNTIWQNLLNSPAAFSGHDEFGDYNQWDNGIVGNFYHNYLAHYPEAINNGGIWSLPYLIAGDSNSTDRYPLVNFPVLEDIIPISNFTANATTIIEGQSVQFYWNPTNEPGGNPPLTILWNFGDGSNETAEFNPIHLYSEPGDYDVNFTITDYEGNSSISNNITITVVVDLLPNASFTYNESIYYQGDEISFKDNTTSGNLPLTYQWNFGDNTPNSTLQNPNHTYSTAGSYMVTFTVTDANGDESVYTEIVWINIEPQGNDLFIIFLSLTVFCAVFEMVAIKAKWNKWVKIISGVAIAGSGIATVVSFLI